MARFILASILVIIPVVLSAEQRFGLGTSQTAGALGGSYGNVQSTNEQHNKKNLGLNLSSDVGSSSSYSGTTGQVGVAGANAQNTYPVGGVPYYQYPTYNPYPYPYYGYPSYIQPYVPPQVPYNAPNVYPGTVGGVGAQAQVGAPQVPGVQNYGGVGASAGVGRY